MSGRFRHCQDAADVELFLLRNIKPCVFLLGDSRVCRFKGKAPSGCGWRPGFVSALHHQKGFFVCFLRLAMSVFGTCGRACSEIVCSEIYFDFSAGERKHPSFDFAVVYLEYFMA